MWKNHQFLSSIRNDAYKRKLVPFFLPHGVVFVSLCHVQMQQVWHDDPPRRLGQDAITPIFAASY